MATVWKKILETGVDWQDQEHKELFERLNQLVESVIQGKGIEEIIRMFRFLDAYAAWHFKDEENAMERLNYPTQTAHRNEHEEFVAQLEKLKQAVLSDPVTGVPIVQKYVMVWLLKHIDKTDRELGAFLKAHSEAVPKGG